MNKPINHRTTPIIMSSYIHQQRKWPTFQWREEDFITLLSEVSNLQGRLMGRVELLGFKLKDEANLEMLIQDVIQSSEIEGEILNPDQVRSSIATRLGLDQSGVDLVDRQVDGVVDMMLDATQTSDKILTAERLFGWHAALFPTGRSGRYKIEVGQWRTEPMQVVSGGLGREIIHFEAPHADRLSNDMDLFLQWFNAIDSLDPILKAAITHLWFVTIHPFSDGNGRIARAITDMQLSKADEVNQRFYSMSAQIKQEKKSYYQLLELTQRGDLDITAWIIWFLECLKKAIHSSNVVIGKVIQKHQFWITHRAHISNERQHHILTKLLDHFEGNLTTSKWAKLTKSSSDTALRDITDLVEKGVLVKLGSGRNTHYVLKE